MRLAALSPASAPFHSGATLRILSAKKRLYLTPAFPPSVSCDVGMAVLSGGRFCLRSRKALIDKGPPVTSCLQRVRCERREWTAGMRGPGSGTCGGTRRLERGAGKRDEGATFCTLQFADYYSVAWLVQTLGVATRRKAPLGDR